MAGEIIAVLNAIDWAWKNGYDQISIFMIMKALENGQPENGKRKPPFQAIINDILMTKMELFLLSL